MPDNNNNNTAVDIADDDEELRLVDLIDVSTLQQIQDAFSDMAGMAALTADKNGPPPHSPARRCWSGCRSAGR